MSTRSTAAASRTSLPQGRRILLTGGGGQVGRELQPLLAALGEVVAPGRAQMDLADATTVRATIERVRPRWIVNAGAYTAVDKAEGEPGAAFAVNAEAVRAIAEGAVAVGAGVVHLSTDYVFDGLKEEPYTEADATAPISVYGRTKLAGEQALSASGAGHAIFRTSWVYGASGKNFVLTILKLAREREVLRIVADQHGSPTWSRDLARLTAHFIDRCEQEAEDGDLGPTLRDLGGLYHASGSGSTTWHEFASEAVQLAKRHEPAATFARLEPITTAEFPTPAARPANSRLSCARLSERLGWHMMDWRQSLREVIEEMERAGV